MKKFMSMALASAMAFSMIPGAVAMADAGSVAGSTIEVAVTYSGDTLTLFQDLVAKYETDNDCKIELDVYGDDYESTLKTRMASNDLPDVWMTHGWSLLRYSEYLMTLNDESWVSDLNESAMGVIQDDSNNIYVLMVDELVNGTLVNLDVCEAAGVDPYSIKTWADFTEACAKVKEAGYTPIGNTVNPGDLANIAGTWLSYEGEALQLSDSMLDGTFDWKNYKIELNDWANWINSGYCFDDALTMSTDDAKERWATDKCAFYLGNDTSYLINARVLNPEGNYAFLPTFASADEGVQFVGVGEGSAFGVWKDTENEAAAKAFLDYLATPEVATQLSTATGNVSCLNSVSAASEEYGQKLVTDMQAKYPEVFYENLWDRKYMPSGMWSIFGTATQMLFDNPSEEGIQEVVDYLAENYTDLYEAAHE